MQEEDAQQQVQLEEKKGGRGKRDERQRTCRGEDLSERSHLSMSRGEIRAPPS